MTKAKYLTKFIYKFLETSGNYQSSTVHPVRVLRLHLFWIDLMI